jgi:17beta-estradiol 17-dehydrogenase / very-long-chain 3-oxoacyl-CoA reductase
MKILNYIILFFVIIELFVIFWIAIKSFYKFCCMKEINHIERYGPNSWALITGGSSGQGRQFALKLANKGFNILLVGSKRSIHVKNEINKNYPNVKVKCIYKNFCNAFKPNFFNKIEKIVEDLDISILVNNVAHRTSWNPYHEMPVKLIKDTISCGTIVQAQLTHILISKFLKRKHKSIILNITAQCNHPTFGLGLLSSNDISVPFLSVYEASNAFGYYHSNSICEEYKDKIDVLNITPGAVITENTEYLQNTLFSIDSEHFVDNAIRFMGNINGTTCAYWGHALSMYLINIFPFNKKKILYDTGYTISNNYMNTKKKIY